MKLAGRKLWSDQDVTTAAALLKSADASPADMNDPSLITVRRAITDDIASLSAVSQVDYDGIILKLNQLSNQVDNLRLADNDSDGSPMDSDGEELSSSISEWRINLQKSWQNFMDNFITIRRRDDTAVPLLRQIRISICAKIFALACWSQHKLYRVTEEETYRRRWRTSPRVRAYYDTDDATTKAFLDEVDQLSQQNISMDLPETLQSRAMLEKIDADPRA